MLERGMPTSTIAASQGWLRTYSSARSGSMNSASLPSPASWERRLRICARSSSRIRMTGSEVMRAVRAGAARASIRQPAFGSLTTRPLKSTPCRTNRRRSVETYSLTECPASLASEPQTARTSSSFRTRLPARSANIFRIPCCLGRIRSSAPSGKRTIRSGCTVAPAEGERGGAQHHPARPRAPSVLLAAPCQELAHAHQQLAVMERLAQEVVRPGVQRLRRGSAGWGRSDMAMIGKSPAVARQPRITLGDLLLVGTVLLLPIAANANS